MSDLKPILKGLNQYQHKYLHWRSADQQDNYNRSKTPSLILDRDGVVIKEEHYISDPKKVQLEKGVHRLILKANSIGWKVVIVTNQSGIYRGYFGWQEYEKVSNRLLEILGDQSLISGIYANGYGPNETERNWRKPNPDMILEASYDLNLDLTRSILIGDRLSDLLAGARADVSMLIHVETGHGESERKHIYNHIIDKGDIKKNPTSSFTFEDGDHSSSIKLLTSLNSFNLDWISNNY